MPQPATVVSPLGQHTLPREASRLHGRWKRLPDVTRGPSSVGYSVGTRSTRPVSRAVLPGLRQLTQTIYTIIGHSPWCIMRWQRSTSSLLTHQFEKSDSRPGLKQVQRSARLGFRHFEPSAVKGDLTHPTDSEIDEGAGRPSGGQGCRPAMPVILTAARQRYLDVRAGISERSDSGRCR